MKKINIQHLIFYIFLEKDPESYVTKTEENSIPADLFSEDDDISQATNEEYEITVPGKLLSFIKV